MDPMAREDERVRVDPISRGDWGYTVSTNVENSVYWSAFHYLNLCLNEKICVRTNRPYHDKNQDDIFSLKIGRKDIRIQTSLTLLTPELANCPHTCLSQQYISYNLIEPDIHVGA